MSVDDTITKEGRFSGDGWAIKELWEKYEEIAMHFNDLLIRLRTQALGGVAALSTLVGLFAKTSASVNTSWKIAAVFFLSFRGFNFAAHRKLRVSEEVENLLR